MASCAPPLTQFVGGIKTLHADIETRLEEQEKRMSMFQAKAAAARGRPALSATETGEPPHRKAFDAYVRSGDDDGLRGLELEGKALVVAGDGGYLVDPQTSATVQSVLAATPSIRQIASVVNVEATSYDVLVDHGGFGSGWASETAERHETDTPSIERISIPLHELSALPKASQRLLDDAAFDIEGWLANRIAATFAAKEAEAFVNGDGNEKPTGFLTYPVVPIAGGTVPWGKIGYVASGGAGEFAGPDSLVDLVYSLGAQYRAGGSFVMNSKTAGKVRKLKDADGRFLWSDGLAAGEPARLLGYPVLVAEEMPDVKDGATAIAFGDFRAGYTIAERPDLRILRDPFSAKPHVLFYATKRVGGDVTDFAAIRLLKFSAT